MSFKYILLDKKDGIATITFHRPEALNALNSEVLADLDAVVDDVIADDEVRVVVPERASLLLPVRTLRRWTETRRWRQFAIPERDLPYSVRLN